MINKKNFNSKKKIDQSDNKKSETQLNIDFIKQIINEKKNYEENKPLTQLGKEMFEEVHCDNIKNKFENNIFFFEILPVFTGSCQQKNRQKDLFFNDEKLNIQIKINPVIINEEQCFPSGRE